MEERVARTTDEDEPHFDNAFTKETQKVAGGYIGTEQHKTMTVIQKRYVNLHLMLWILHTRITLAILAWHVKASLSLSTCNLSQLSLPQTSLLHHIFY